jgi:hypothetical protein
MHNANYTKEINSNEEIFQLEIKSKKFHQRKFSSVKKYIKHSSYCSLIAQQYELDFSTIGTLNFF